MIKGIGTDLIEVGRVARLLDGSAGERFLQRVLTEPERVLAAKRAGRLAEFTAGRFAAKEAVAKALGCGIGGSLGFHDITVTADACGKPVCRVSDRSGRLLGVGLEDKLHVSITHTGAMAAAFVVWESLQEENGTE